VAGAEGEARREGDGSSTTGDGHHSLTRRAGGGGETGTQLATVCIVLDTVSTDDPAVRVDTGGADQSPSTHVFLHCRHRDGAQALGLAHCGRMGRFFGRLWCCVSLPSEIILAALRPPAVLDVQ